MYLDQRVRIAGQLSSGSSVSNRSQAGLDLSLPKISIPHHLTLALRVHHVLVLLNE
jgi:hypothetical protein